MTDFQKSALVADGSDAFRQTVRGVLTERLGLAAVVEARTLPNALERLSCRDIGLAIIDLGLPGMTGPASLRPLRERRPDLRIAVSSASQRRRDILLALDTGMHGFVPKSFGPDELARGLGAILDGLIYVPPVLADIRSDPLGRAESEEIPALACELDPLTPRQREVLELLVKGLSNKEIARALSLGPGTVKVHVSALFRSLGATSRSAAAVSGARLLATRS